MVCRCTLTLHCRVNLTILDEFPGHAESVRELYESDKYDTSSLDHLYIPEDKSAQEPVKIDKSNLLLIGPTGVGKTYILEYVRLYLLLEKL